LLPCGRKNIPLRPFFALLAFLSAAGGKKSIYHEGHEEHEEKRVVALRAKKLSVKSCGV
jgi:hypothetical protein